VAERPDFLYLFMIPIVEHTPSQLTCGWENRFVYTFFLFPFFIHVFLHVFMFSVKWTPANLWLRDQIFIHFYESTDPQPIILWLRDQIFIPFYESMDPQPIILWLRDQIFYTFLWYPFFIQVHVFMFRVWTPAIMWLRDQIFFYTFSWYRSLRVQTPSQLYCGWETRFFFIPFYDTQFLYLFLCWE
jgi:hypothetical protein